MGLKGRKFGKTHLRGRRSAGDGRTVVVVVVVAAVGSVHEDILTCVLAAVARLNVAALGLSDVCPLPLSDLSSPATGPGARGPGCPEGGGCCRGRGRG